MDGVMSSMKLNQMIRYIMEVCIQAKRDNKMGLL